MFNNSAFTLFKSPRIMYDNPEFSPLQILSKFQMTSRKSKNDSEDKISRNMNNFDIHKFNDESSNKLTPSYKLSDKDKQYREIIDLKGNIIINQNDDEENKFMSESNNLKFSSSLKRSKFEKSPEEFEHDNFNNFNYPNQPNITNIIINYQNINLTIPESQIQQFLSEEKNKKICRLNEIIINGKKIKYLINFLINDSDSLEVIYPLYENNFYKLNKNISEAQKGTRFSKSFHNLLNLVEDADYINKLVTTPRFKDLYELKFLKISKIIVDPVAAYKKYVIDFKKNFNLLQNDYISKKKKSLNANLISKLEISIDAFNNLVDIIFECVNYIKRGKGIKRKKKKADYDCDLCQKKFPSAQSKGGHMSKMHPNESLKYKSKILVRESRVGLRDIVLQAKKELLAKYNFDYDELMQNMEKNLISDFLKLHKSEYSIIKKRLKSEDAQLQ